MSFPNIEKTKDKKYLYDNLSEEQLKIIDDVLDSYWNGKIDLNIPRFEDDTPDFCGEFELIINDKDYKETGYEITIIKWIEDFEDTGYLVDVMEEIK